MNSALFVQDFLSFLALQEKAPAAANAAAATPSGNPMQFVMLIVFVVFIFYFLILRPQKKEQEKRQKEISELSKGDKVITIGGIHGTIVDINKDEDTITLSVDKDSKLTFSRTAVSRAIVKKNSPETANQGGKSKG